MTMKNIKKEQNKILVGNRFCPQSKKMYIEASSVTNQNGITIITLVITIIILLILSAIVIKLSIGENGIIEKSKLAGEKYQNVANNEQKELNNISKYLNGDWTQGGDSSTNGNMPNNIEQFTPNITDIKSHGFTISADTSSDEAEIICYTFIVNGKLKQSSSNNTCIVTDLDANTEYEIIVVAIDSLGNSRKAITKARTKDEIVFTEEYLNQGQTVGNVAITQNNYNGTPGLSITGNCARPVGVATNWNIYPESRWYKEIDLTNYNTLQFYSKKGQDHGTLFIAIDGIGIFSVSYKNATTTWKLYNVDLSKYTGKHVISILGGYQDNTGNASSNTQYCDIRLTTK